MIHFIVLSLFNEMFDTFLESSIIKRATQSKILDVKCIDIREYSDNLYKKVDDTPYGGGAGMLMMAEPVARAIDEAIGICKTENFRIFYMSPRGRVLSYDVCKNLADSSCDTTYILLCGHYEGIDERVLEYYNIEEISIGDYVLTGGELPAMVVIDSITRLVDGVITKESLIDESHTGGLLEYPQYTKPAIWRNLKVPDVLLSGNHKNIENYRKAKSLELTMKNRPDLLKSKNNI